MFLYSFRLLSGACISGLGSERIPAVKFTQRSRFATLQIRSAISRSFLKREHNAVEKNMRNGAEFVDVNVLELQKGR